MNNYFFTSESVCAGHPDKICDQVSDAIVDAVLRYDPYGRIAVETLVTTNQVVIAGEVTTNKKIKYDRIAQDQIRRLGYTDPSYDFSYNSPITVHVHTQSPEIAQGVDAEGAGDQGMMFGFACRDTQELMPAPITIAHRLTARIDEVREKKILPYLRPDGKSQVTIEYKNGKPYKVTSIVLAVPHAEQITREEARHGIIKNVVNIVLDEYGFEIKPSDIIFNGTGVWHNGGPAQDTGVTGRKIVVDTYGGYARVGGGAFSGKDPTKVDRSGAYAARFIAKNIVAAGLAERAEVALAYFIGAKKPIMQTVETFDTAKKSQKVIADFASKLIDTSVKGILERLDLRRPIYLPTAAYGHFGRSIFPWEEVVFM